MGNPRVFAAIPVPIPAKNPYPCGGYGFFCGYRYSNPYPYPRRVYPRVTHKDYMESSYYKAVKYTKGPIPNNACISSRSTEEPCSFLYPNEIEDEITALYARTDTN